MTFLAPVFSCAVPLVSSTSRWLAPTKCCRSRARVVTLRILAMAARPPVSLPMTLFLVAAQLVDVDHGRAEVHAQVGHVADFVHDRGHVQQRLGRNATHVQAHAAQGGVALDQRSTFRPRSAARKAARVAAGAAAEHRARRTPGRRCRRSCWPAGAGGVEPLQVRAAAGADAAGAASRF